MELRPSELFGFRRYKDGRVYEWRGTMVDITDEVEARQAAYDSGELPRPAGNAFAKAFSEKLDRDLIEAMTKGL